VLSFDGSTFVGSLRHKDDVLENEEENALAETNCKIPA
jgi:hypothetical protein